MSDRLTAMRRLRAVTTELRVIESEVSELLDAEHEEVAYWIGKIRQARECGAPNLIHSLSRLLDGPEQTQAVFEGLL